MKKLFSLVSISVFVAARVSCHKNAVTPSGTVYLDLPATSYQYYTPSYGDTTVNSKATLGRVLFYDGHLSVNNSISCASCHKQAFGFSDNNAFSTGFEGKITRRNSKGIHNIVGVNNFFSNIILQHNTPLFWDGRENSLLNLVDRPITNHVEMGITDPDALAPKIAAISCYPPLFKKAYGDEQVTSARISECISMFMASIQSTNSKIDQYFKGNTTVLNALELKGMGLFNSTYNCASCHHSNSGPYTFFDFHDIGLDENYNDLGMGVIFSSTTDNGKFRVPDLANVALTAPYMHDGRYKTLDDVLEHYSHNIKNSPNLDPVLRGTDQKAKQMNISSDDKMALIAFLNTFTDYTTIQDPKFSNPFKVK